MILELLFKQHKLWISYVKSFGCRAEIAEDFVQDLYIKLNEKNVNDLLYNEDKINQYYVFICLRNMYFDSLRKQKKNIQLTDIFCEVEAEPTDFIEIQLLQVENWIKNINDKIIDLSEDNYTPEHLDLNYKMFIYTSIFVDKKSVTKLSEDLKISYWSLRNTIKNIKIEIQCS